MTLVITIRPEPGNAATIAAAQERGLQAVGFPLFLVRALPWHAPAPNKIDALLIGSANALRHGGNALRQYVGKPAYAVGAVTASAATAAGLNVIATGDGGLDSLRGQIAPGHHRLLRLAGSARVSLSPPPGTTVTERLVYSSDARPIPDELARLLTSHTSAGSVVLLHSAAAARHFAAECERQALGRSRLRLAALAPRIAVAAGSGWMEVGHAPVPSEAALLELVAHMCHKRTMAEPDG